MITGKASGSSTSRNRWPTVEIIVVSRPRPGETPDLPLGARHDLKLQPGKGTASCECLSVALGGLPRFAQAVLANVRPDAIEPTTLPILEATARGEPPSLWQ